VRRAEVRRARIDYRMQRRAALRDVASGLRSPADVCDAHPELLRASRHIGTPVDEPCPLCDGGRLVQVTYVFDTARRGPRSGRAVPRSSLPHHLERYGDLDVYTVEVCPSCGWHHLVESYVLVARHSAVG